MSMGIIRGGEYDKVAGCSESGELVIGASTIRKGTFTFVKRPSNQFCDATVTFNTPMPDDDYEVVISWVTIYGTSMYGRVQNKTKNGFSFNGYYANENDANTYGNQEVAYTAFKLFTKEGLEDLENSVAELTEVKTITPTAVTGGAAGTISWDSFDVKKLGKLVNVTISNMTHTLSVSSVGNIVIATGLPKPALGRIYLAGINYGDDGNRASAYIDANGSLGIDTGFLLATSKLYGSVTYIATE